MQNNSLIVTNSQNLLMFPKQTLGETLNGTLVWSCDYIYI